MSNVPTKIVLVLVVVAALLATSALVGACSDGDTDTTLTTSSSTNVEPSTDDGPAAPQEGGTVTQDNERVVVGGKTADEYEGMIPTLEQSLQDDPENLQTLQDLAIAQYNTGKYEEAAATYEKMLSLEDTAFTRNNYANVLRDWEKTEDAITNYQKAISMDNTLVTPYLNLASILVREGRIEEAKDTLESAQSSVSAEDQERVDAYLEQIETATTSSS